MPKALALALGIGCVVVGAAVLAAGYRAAGIVLILASTLFDLMFLFARRRERRPHSR
jgi:membrane protein implicated in regulation of membrane protease activity